MWAETSQVPKIEQWLRTPIAAAEHSAEPLTTLHRIDTAEAAVFAIDQPFSD